MTAVKNLVAEIENPAKKSHFEPTGAVLFDFLPQAHLFLLHIRVTATQKRELWLQIEFW
jgi:hypothetical protein